MLLFLKVFFTEFIAEMGDKTQLMLIALTSKYKLKRYYIRNSCRNSCTKRIWLFLQVGWSVNLFLTGL